MEILLQRSYPKKEYTIGNFRIDGRWFSSSLEDADRDLIDSMPLQEIQARKVYGKTAIPKGRYRVGFSYSPKFANRPWAKPYGGRVVSIEGVKGFEGVRIHPGNSADDTSGCVLIGLNKVKGRLVDSQATYLDFVNHFILPATARQEQIYITIV